MDDHRGFIEATYCALCGVRIKRNPRGGGLPRHCKLCKPVWKRIRVRRRYRRTKAHKADVTQAWLAKHPEKIEQYNERRRHQHGPLNPAQRMRKRASDRVRDFDRRLEREVE